MSEEPLSLDSTKIVIVSPMEQETAHNSETVTTVAAVTLKKRRGQRESRIYWRWCSVITSIVALVGGFAVVLVFSHVFVVPHLETEHYIQTDCYIREIDFYSLQRNCSPSDCHTSRCVALSTTYAHLQPQKFDLCAKVKVRYYSLEGRLELAVLNPELQTESSDPSYNHTNKCGCGFFDILQPGENKSALGKFRGAEFYQTDQSDQNNLLVVAAGRILRAQSKTRCYYRRKTIDQQVLSWRANRHVVLHAILWPTIIFVIGFVGLFFSCLTVQKEKHTRKKPTKACIV